ncbi:MAG: DnaB-like helicase C-terminal domain-containing protein, partial [Gemmatimonadota bacterium]
AAGHLNTAPVWIDDSGAVSVLEMRAKARRLKSDQPDLGLVIIDYIQLMNGGNAENRQQEVSAISRGLKSLAKELDVPIIALSQLSRAPEQRADHRPQLSDLRESGSIEQDADLVMFLYRPEYYESRDAAQEKGIVGKAELIISKQRNGPTGTVDLFFRKECARFESFSHAQPH